MRSRPLRYGLWLLLTAVLVVAGFLAFRPAGKPATPAPAGPSGSRVAQALASLQRQANDLLAGGPSAFQDRVGSLRGYPVVVNQWASWCGPCRYEFPFFQRLAHRLRGRVAFLGVDSQDSRGAARKFLREFPVPYPHYFDPDASVARVFRGGQAWPTTAFYDASGRLTDTHPGAYATQAKLQQDIEHYAIHG